MSIEVKDWTDQETPKDDIAWSWLGGFFEEGMRWKDYIEYFEDAVKPYLEALRRDIVDKNLRFGGDDHQDSPSGTPVFSDDKSLKLSYRAWGDLMAACWSEHEDKDYSYMHFYMTNRQPA